MSHGWRNPRKLRLRASTEASELRFSSTLFYTFQHLDHTAKRFVISNLGIRNTLRKHTVRVSRLFSTTFNATLVKSGHLDRLESAMHAMQATEAKARSAGLLRKVERGQSVVGTRHGEAIANVIPARAGERADRKQRVARFRRRREEWQPFATSIDDILLARHQGHRC